MNSLIRNTKKNNKLFYYSKDIPQMSWGTDVLPDVTAGATAGATVGSIGGPWGTLIGGVVGAGAGLYTGNEKHQDKDKQEKIKQAELAKLSMKNYAPPKMDENYWSPYSRENTQGSRMYSSYAYGGVLKDAERNKLFRLADGTANMNEAEIPTQNAEPINENADIVTNDNGGTDGSHEQGDNIPVQNQNGQVTAEVEPGEVIVDMPDGKKAALSKRLGFAQKYLALNDKLKELTGLKSNDKFKNTEIERELEGIKTQMLSLPQQQEFVKQQMGIKNDSPNGVPQGGYGLYGDPWGEEDSSEKYSSGMTTIPSRTIDTIPYSADYSKEKTKTPTLIPENTDPDEESWMKKNMTASNVNKYGDAIQTGVELYERYDYNKKMRDKIDKFNKKPVPTPTFINAPVLRTEWDNKADINTINENLNKGMAMSNRFVNSQVGAAYNSRLLENATEQTNKSNQDKENRELGLSNSAVLQRHNTQVQNAALSDDWKKRDYDKWLKGEIEMPSMVDAKNHEDFQQLMNRIDKNQYQNQQLNLERLRASDTGSSIYADAAMIGAKPEDLIKMSKADVIKQYGNTTTTQRLISLLGIK